MSEQSYQQKSVSAELDLVSGTFVSEKITTDWRIYVPARTSAAVVKKITNSLFHLIYDFDDVSTQGVLIAIRDIHPEINIRPSTLHLSGLDAAGHRLKIDEVYDVHNGKLLRQILSTSSSQDLVTGTSRAGDITSTWQAYVPQNISRNVLEHFEKQISQDLPAVYNRPHGLLNDIIASHFETIGIEPLFLRTTEVLSDGSIKESLEGYASTNPMSKWHTPFTEFRNAKLEMKTSQINLQYQDQCWFYERGKLTETGLYNNGRFVGMWHRPFLRNGEEYTWYALDGSGTEIKHSAKAADLIKDEGVQNDLKSYGLNIIQDGDGYALIGRDGHEIDYARSIEDLIIHDAFLQDITRQQPPGADHAGTDFTPGI